jgi:methylase of polypeptide subunit release factors
MANEKKTERIVYAHFEKNTDIIRIEEQSSDIPKIDKLLKSASKKGTGKGYPEFIITYHKNNDFLIVVECKAEITKHESPNRDKYADFAVDGVLLYTSFLSKEFDVLAVAVSGETTQQLKVSHFLHLKGEKKATEIFGDTLLSAPEYLQGYLKSPEKFRQDYNALLDFTKVLNDTLHTYKILESQRSLLISCILIALEDEAFKISYPKKTNPKNLADFLTKTVTEKLEDSNILGDKLENLATQFGFIKTDTSLSTKENILKELIDKIDENINSFIKTHEYFDVLGQLYIEFLRYANSDKGLGIVLTPPHITELFAELAQVNKNSIVFDNCTGTGGFLIAAMKKMIEDAKGDTKKIAEIKTNQLIGVEYQAHIFALAVSNMYIHQDGKTNILNGSCFDEKIINEIKTKKPTIGFLNPPYKADKKKDIDELEFILNNLDCLVDGGTCIAIVPMQSALATSGKVLEYKKKLLAYHTLEAVLSMPDELFFNSNVGVVSCIMIFTAHKSHPKNKETFFGYFKDDGFVKRKIQGRIDAFGKWDMIKEKWISYFINRKTEAGFSVNKAVKAEDEWCAEAYMETDYSSLESKQFEDVILNYITFLVSNRLIKNSEKMPFSPNE